MVIGLAERGDIAFSRFAGVDQAHATPGKALAAKRYEEQIGSQPGMTAIAVRIGMDPYQAMMKP